MAKDGCGALHFVLRASLVIIAAAVSSQSAQGGIVYQNMDPSIGGITLLVQDSSNAANTVARQVGDIVTLSKTDSSVVALDQFRIGFDYQGSAITQGLLTLRIWEYQNNTVVNGDNPYVVTTTFSRPFSSDFSPFTATFSLQGLNINISTPEVAFLVEAANLNLGLPAVVTNTLRLTTNNNNPGPGSSSADTFAIGGTVGGFALLDSNFGGNVNALISGFEIFATPEPSSLALAGLAGLIAVGAGWRCRRRGCASSF